MTNNYLKEFLNIHWLRPETAILNSLLAKSLPNDYLKNGYNIDISCGDGLFSFINNGGSLDNSFNIYNNTNLKDSIVKKEDIYNYVDDSYHPKIINKPVYNYDIGLDFSENMLLKADKLGIYNSLYKYQSSQSFNIKKTDSIENFHTKNTQILKEIQFDKISIFSSIYMYKDLNLLLNTLNSLLKRNGLLIVNVKNSTFKDVYENIDNTYPKSFSQYLERNMRNVFPNLLSIKEWETFFEENNFIIESKLPTLQKNLTPVWTIGLRFLTPLLVKMSNSIENEIIFSEIKEEFVDTFYKVLIDFYEEDIKEASSYLYILKKK